MMAERGREAEAEEVISNRFSCFRTFWTHPESQSAAGAQSLPVGVAAGMPECRRVEQSR